MADRKVDIKENRSNNWWIIAVIVIVAILVAWIALSEQSTVGEVETPEEPVVPVEEQR